MFSYLLFLWYDGHREKGQYVYILECRDSTYYTGYTKEYVKAAIRLDGRDPKALKNTFVSGILGDFLTEEILLLNEK